MPSFGVLLVIYMLHNGQYSIHVNFHHGLHGLLSSNTWRFKCYFNIDMPRFGSGITVVHFEFANKKKYGRMGLQFYMVIRGTVQTEFWIGLIPNSVLSVMVVTYFFC